MAYKSGYAATQAMAEGHTPEIFSKQVNEGLGEGFAAGWPLAVLAYILEAWT